MRYREGAEGREIKVSERSEEKMEAWTGEGQVNNRGDTARMLRVHARKEKERM